MLYPTQKIAISLYQSLQKMTLQEQINFKRNLKILSDASQECTQEIFIEYINQTQDFSQDYIDLINDIHNKVGIEKFPTILTVLEQLLSGEHVAVECTFSQQPTLQIQHDIQSYIKKQFPNCKYVLLDINLEPSMILGYNIKIGDQVRHFSLKNSLELLAERLAVA